MIKNLPANAEYTGLIPGSERSLGVGNGNPLQYSCLGNPMDRGAWWVKVQHMGLQRVGYNWACTHAKFHCLHTDYFALIFIESLHFLKNNTFISFSQYIVIFYWSSNQSFRNTFLVFLAHSKCLPIFMVSAFDHNSLPIKFSQVLSSQCSKELLMSHMLCEASQQ